MHLAIHNLSKKYAKRTGVEGINLQVAEGEKIAILGPRASGKSTLMRIISGYIRPDGGSMLVNDSVIKKHDPRLKSLLGYLPENNPLYREMPLQEYLAFAGRLQGMYGRALKNRVMEVIVICGLEREKHKKIAELSHGNRQRTGLAQAVLHRPDLLLLDEPTTGLDPGQVLSIDELIRSVSADRSMILATENQKEAECLADRIIALQKGRILSAN